ncbi:YqhG family protein [Alicyclobacillus tolerans]|uniref:YqhG family protein n=1 Tax=Alicyclobacillus tolerans TaxID=90970 RepID=UPI001F42F119|nr:YqhG family protein [Alicyclobacillus tolerans]MCF8563575.1 YqhG family protein [Alicyclobacillus tolerans]
MRENVAALRTVRERMRFCDAYFEAVGSQTVYCADEYREYELPRDVDKELTDRPYYWLWVEQTGQTVPPTVLRLAFSEEALNRENERLRAKALAEIEHQQMSDIERMFFRPPTAELVSMGSFRLEKIYASIMQRGRFACVKPVTANESQYIVPWLLYNVQISYRCDLMEQELVSIGVCLTNGQVVEHFYDMISRITMQPMDPDEVTSRQNLNLDEAIKKAHRYLETKLASQSHDWAETAANRLEKEIRQVRTYYQSILPDLKDEEKSLVEAEQLRKERELTERTQPKIELESQQMALVGLIEQH